MKNSSILGIVVASVAILQGCAGTVNPEKKSTQTLITGSEKLVISSKECPRGIGVVRLYRNTLEGVKTNYNAKVAVTKEPIKNEMNVYSLLKENTITEGLNHNQSNKPPKDKVEIITELNSVRITLSDKIVDPVQGKFNPGENALTNQDAADEGEDKAELNKPLGIRYIPKLGFYASWGQAPDINLIQSVSPGIEEDAPDFAFPETIDSKDLEHPFNKRFEVKAGEPLVINIAPKKTDIPGTLFAQFMIRPKKGVIDVYNYIKKEGPGETSFEIPTKDVKPGNYLLNVFRSEVTRMPLEDGHNFCMELSTGFMGRVAVAPPEEAKK